MVYTHILVSTPFPGVMLSLSLLRGGCYSKLSAFGVLHQEEHHVHVDGFTSLGILLMCLLTCFHTSLFLLWSAAQCYIQPSYIWHLFFCAGYYFFVLFSISRSALLWPTEQFIALGPPVSATAPSHHWAVFGASTSQGCYLTNLYFCTWHHYGRVIKSWWFTIQRQNKRKQISCRHLVIRKNVVTAEPYWSKAAGKSVKVQTEQTCQSSDLRSCKLSTTLMATC